MATVTKTKGYSPGVELVVTEGRVEYPNQKLGIRLFKDAASGTDRYRIYMTGGGRWFVSHNGRWICDTPEMVHGASNPGVLIDQIRRIRGW